MHTPQRRSSGLGIGLLLVLLSLTGCGSGPVASPAVSPSPSVAASVTCLPTNMPTPAAAMDQQGAQVTRTPTLEYLTVRDQMDHAQQVVQQRFPGVAFPLAFPHNLAGLTPQPPLITEPPSPPVVGIRLVDPQHPERWVGFGQSVGGFGASEIPLSDTLPIHGVTALVGCGTTTRGEPIVVMQWDQAGITYNVTGQHVDARLVVQVARSVAPLTASRP